MIEVQTQVPLFLELLTKANAQESKRKDSKIKPQTAVF